MSTSVANPSVGTFSLGANAPSQQPLSSSPLSTSPSATSPSATGVPTSCFEEARGAAAGRSPIMSPLSTSPSSSFMYRGSIDIKYLAQRQQEELAKPAYRYVPLNEESSEEDEEEEEEEEEDEEEGAAVGRRSSRDDILFEEELVGWCKRRSSAETISSDVAAAVTASTTAAAASVAAALVAAITTSAATTAALAKDTETETVGAGLSLGETSTDDVEATPAASAATPTKKTRTNRNLRRHISWGDEQGGNLTHAKHFLRDDEPWKCSSKHQANPILYTFASLKAKQAAPNQEAVMEFDSSILPLSQADLTAALAAKTIVLESVCMRAPLVFLTIRVLNIAFEKHVFVRVTTDNWASYNDVQASYLPGSSNPRSDRFYATLSLPGYDKCQGIKFALCMRSCGQEHWDSNGGANYTIHLNKNTLTRRFGVNLDAYSPANTPPY